MPQDDTGLPKREEQRPSAILKKAHWEEVGRVLRLSPRELDVALCALDNFSNKRTAKELGITENTVKSHITRICLKLGIRDRSGIGGRFFIAWELVRDQRSETSKGPIVSPPRG
jgi:DNA-binding CsgD family transcriptional regulator